MNIQQFKCYLSLSPLSLFFIITTVNGTGGKITAMIKEEQRN